MESYESMVKEAEQFILSCYLLQSQWRGEHVRCTNHNMEEQNEKKHSGAP